MKKFKWFKKISCILLAFIILSVQIVIPEENVNAKTLRDLKNELHAKQEEYEQNKEQHRLTEEQMVAVHQKIGEITAEKNQIEIDIAALNEEINTLSNQIVKKNEEIKAILNYYQITSTGEAAYLEYLFKSKDFTDFIYRLAVAEQLSEYNSNLIDEYNALIVQNEEKKVELNNKMVELQNKQQELESELVNLSANLDDIMDATVSVEDEIKSLEEYIDIYENQYNCQDDDDLDYCTRDQLPPGTAFYRPTQSGRISANYGWYYPWGYAQWHYGIDISQNYLQPVYATAAGKVVAIYPRQSCGGNMVYIQHYVNGQTWTSSYYHMASVTVNVGDSVTPDTQIGTVGGTRNEYWDSCSTGAHLHFQIAYGLYLQDYASYNSFCANSLDPRNLVNFPAEGYYYSDRTTRY